MTATTTVPTSHSAASSSSSSSSSSLSPLPSPTHRLRKSKASSHVTARRRRARAGVVGEDEGSSASSEGERSDDDAINLVNPLAASDEDDDDDDDDAADSNQVDKPAHVQESDSADRDEVELEAGLRRTNGKANGHGTHNGLKNSAAKPLNGRKRMKKPKELVPSVASTAASSTSSLASPEFSHAEDSRDETTAVAADGLFPLTRKVPKISEGQSPLVEGPFGESTNGAAGAPVASSSSTTTPSESREVVQKVPSSTGNLHLVPLDEFPALGPLHNIQSLFGNSLGFHQASSSSPSFSHPGAPALHIIRDGRPDPLSRAPPPEAEARFERVHPSEFSVQVRLDEDREEQRKERKREKAKEKRLAKKAAAAVAAAAAIERAATGKTCPSSEGTPDSPALSTRTPTLAPPPSLPHSALSDRRPSSRLSVVAYSSDTAGAAIIVSPSSPVPPQEPWQVPRIGRFWGHDDRSGLRHRGGRGGSGSAGGPHFGDRGGRGRGRGGAGMASSGSGHGMKAAEWEERRRERVAASSTSPAVAGPPTVTLTHQSHAAIRPDTPAGRSDRSGRSGGSGMGSGWVTVRGRGGFGPGSGPIELDGHAEWRHDGWEEMEREEGFRHRGGGFRVRGRGWRGVNGGFGRGGHHGSSSSTVNGTPNGATTPVTAAPSSQTPQVDSGAQDALAVRPPEAPWTTKSPVPFLFNAPGSRSYTDSSTGKGVVEAQVAVGAAAAKSDSGGAVRDGNQQKGVRIELSGASTPTEPFQHEEQIRAPVQEAVVKLPSSGHSASNAIKQSDAVPDQTIVLVDDASAIASHELTNEADSTVQPVEDTPQSTTHAEPSMEPAVISLPDSRTEGVEEGASVLREALGSSPAGHDYGLPAPTAFQSILPPPSMASSIGYPQGYYGGPPSGIPYMDPATGVAYPPHHAPGPFGYAPHPNAQAAMYGPHYGVGPMFDPSSVYGPPLPHPTLAPAHLHNGSPLAPGPATTQSASATSVLAAGPTPMFYAPARSTKVRISKPQSKDVSLPQSLPSQASIETDPSSTTTGGSGTAASDVVPLPAASRTRRKMSFGSTFRGGSISSASGLVSPSPTSAANDGASHGIATPASATTFYELNGVTYYSTPPPPPPPPPMAMSHGYPNHHPHAYQQHQHHGSLNGLGSAGYYDYGTASTPNSAVPTTSTTPVYGQMKGNHPSSGMTSSTTPPPPPPPLSQAPPPPPPMLEDPSIISQGPVPGSMYYGQGYGNGYANHHQYEGYGF